jgi:hypothetical protein
MRNTVMALSRQSIENLLDLVEIKIGALQILDREDEREMRSLESCRTELLAMQEALKARRRGIRVEDNVVRLAH